MKRTILEIIGGPFEGWPQLALFLIYFIGSSIYLPETDGMGWIIIKEMFLWLLFTVPIYADMEPQWLEWERRERQERIDEE